GQQLAWVDPHGELEVGPVLPATEPPLRWPTLPPRYIVSHIGSTDGLEPWLPRLDDVLGQGPALVQVREPARERRARDDDSEAKRLEFALATVLERCRAAGARCLVNAAHRESWWTRADGGPLRAPDLTLRRGVPRSPALVAASVHSEAERQAASDMNVDF